MCRARVSDRGTIKLQIIPTQTLPYDFFEEHVSKLMQIGQDTMLEKLHPNSFVGLDGLKERSVHYSQISLSPEEACGKVKYDTTGFDVTTHDLAAGRGHFRKFPRLFGHRGQPSRVWGASPKSPRSPTSGISPGYTVFHWVTLVTVLQWVSLGFFGGRESVHGAAVGAAAGRPPRTNAAEERRPGATQPCDRGRDAQEHQGGVRACIRGGDGATANS